MNSLHVFCVVLLLFYANWTTAQEMRNIFFEMKQDSAKDRSANVSIPMQGQTIGVSGSFITDFVGRTRMALLTSIIAAKNDTSLVMHSLFNGFGNLTGDIETPLAVVKLRKFKDDFAGLSLNTRMSALVDPDGNIEESTGSIDMGLNGVVRVKGDYENINAKVVFRNAMVWGNFKFLQQSESSVSRWIYYNQLQLKVNTLGNTFLFNMPLMFKILGRKSQLPLPLYASVGFHF